MRVLLDTNAYSFFTRGHEEVHAIVEDAQGVVLSTVVVGELLFGFRLGTQFDENYATLLAYIAKPSVSVVDVGIATAENYASIFAALRAKGRPIPANDIWIAAHAMETGADLVSADAHFEHVDGLSWTRIPPR